MRKLAIVTTLAASIALFSAVPASAAGTTGSYVGVEIVAALSISNTVGLEFGQVVPSVVIGTVTVGTNGSRSSAGGVTLTNGTPATASSFAVTGGPDSAYAITLPTSITIAGPVGAPMVVNAFQSSPTVLVGGRLDAQGTQTLLVGATLNVGVSQLATNYAGTFDVTVTYN